MQFGWLTLAMSPSPEEDGARIDDIVEQVCEAETAGLFRRLADRALFHRRERLQRLADVRRGAGDEDQHDPARLRRRADAVPSSGAARGPAGAARQSQQGPHRRRHRQGHRLQRVRVRRPRPAQPRQPRAHGRDGRHPRSAPGPSRRSTYEGKLPQGARAGDPAQAGAAARPAAVAQRDLARLVQRSAAGSACRS